MDKFNPPDKNLSPISELLSKAEVKKEDIDDAITDWKDDPPIPDFENFLEPEIDPTI